MTRRILLTGLIATFGLRTQLGAQATYALKTTPKTVTCSQRDAEFWAEFPGMPRNQLFERVGPTQPGETSEVPVGGVQDAAVLHRERRQIGVTDERAARLPLLYHLPQQAPVLLSGRQQGYVRLRQPLLHDLGGFLGREALSRKARVRNDAEKGGYGLPW